MAASVAHRGKAQAAPGHPCSSVRDPHKAKTPPSLLPPLPPFTLSHYPVLSSPLGVLLLIPSSARAPFPLATVRLSSFFWSNWSKPVSPLPFLFIKMCSPIVSRVSVLIKATGKLVVASSFSEAPLCCAMGAADAVPSWDRLPVGRFSPRPLCTDQPPSHRHRSLLQADRQLPSLCPFPPTASARRPVPCTHVIPPPTRTGASADSFLWKCPFALRPQLTPDRKSVV